MRRIIHIRIMQLFFMLLLVIFAFNIKGKTTNNDITKNPKLLEISANCNFILIDVHNILKNVKENHISVNKIYEDQFLQTYRVATFNIRSANMKEEFPERFWSNRNLLVQDMIRKYDFDIFGVQEAWEVQLDDLESLKSYTNFGVSINGDNTRAHNNIFFKNDRFKLLSSGTFWLSPEGPTVPTGPSWDANQKRNCTWGKLKDIDSGDQFYVFNTHFDNIGSNAKKESASLIINKVSEITGNYPVILMGDLNTDQTQEGYTILQKSSFFSDAFFISKFIQSKRATSNRWDPDIPGDRRIDHILLTSHWHSINYQVLTDTYGDSLKILPSDHFPVLVEIILKSKIGDIE